MLAVGIAVAVRLGSPVLLRQPRVGKGGREFRVYKFRTMTPDRRTGADAAGEWGGECRRIRHKSPDDPRLVPLGRFLRAWSLDELPQLFNVVLGDMSLVGPRPEMVAIVKRYEDWQHQRHLVKPGMTGLWQISERGNGLMHERTDVDLEYVQRVSLRTDLKILLFTIPAALGMHKGY
jgi:lipopolysaccharide/colanic/teichoic acid biosynthesis glycosyltransferase